MGYIKAQFHEKRKQIFGTNAKNYIKELRWFLDDCHIAVDAILSITLGGFQKLNNIHELHATKL